MTNTLADIPVIEAPHGPLQLAQQHIALVKNVLTKTNELLPSFILGWGDKYAVEFLRNSHNPYQAEIAEIAGLMGRSGGYALNLSFEMGCTTGCRLPEGQTAMQIYRTLDWPFRLGRDVVVARHDTPVGGYYNITWPGYVGVLTAMAPGRFAAAINQPPMSYSFDTFGLSLPIDWIVNRLRIRKMTAIPPTHLLRQAFEQCKTYDEARQMLTTTPICIPVIYTLTGTKPNEGCIIERRENEAVVHEGPVCITNHWLAPQFKGRPRRARNSRTRLTAMQKNLPTIKGDFDWVVPPVLDSFTRMASEMNAGTGSLLLQGWHGDEAQTKVLRMGVGLT